MLGVDPGLADTGYGFIIKEGQKLKIITCGSIKTSAKDDFIKRLEIIHQELEKLIKPVREYFEKNKKAKELYNVVRQIKITR